MPSDRYSDLESLAKVKISRSAERLAKEYTERTAAVNLDFAARGLSRSGAFDVALLNSKMQMAEELCREVSAIWANLIRRKYHVLTDADADFIVRQVRQKAEHFGKNIQSSMSPAPEATTTALHAESATRLQAIANGIDRDLRIALREAALMPVKDGAVTDEVFVIMGADEDLAPVYTEAIAPAIGHNGLTPYLMVSREPKNQITDEILSRIESARLIIADMTYEKPNCYYEAGYAHAKGKQSSFALRPTMTPGGRAVARAHPRFTSILTTTGSLSGNRANSTSCGMSWPNASASH